MSNEQVLGPQNEFLSSTTVINKALYLLKNYTIPCDGFVQSFTYRSNGKNFHQFIGLWRMKSKTNTETVYQKIHNLFVPKSSIEGNITVFPRFPFEVKKDDILSLENKGTNELNNIVLAHPGEDTLVVYEVSLVQEGKQFNHIFY